jgi:hypothetical protein
VCLRQVRAWFAKDDGGKRQLVCCENHQSNALMWAIEKGEVKVSSRERSERKKELAAAVHQHLSERASNSFS